MFFSGHPASWPGRTPLTGHIGADLFHLGPEVSPSPAFPGPPPSVEPHCHLKTSGPGLTPSVPWLPLVARHHCVGGRWETRGALYVGASSLLGWLLREIQGR